MTCDEFDTALPYLAHSHLELKFFCPKKTDNFLLDILALSVKYDNHQGTDYLNINRTLEPWSP